MFTVQGDRVSDYSVMGYSPETERFEEMAIYDGSLDRLTANGVRHSWFWPGPEGKPPKDLPVCGWDRSHCPDQVQPFSSALQSEQPYGENCPANISHQIFTRLFC